jgi:hypothetical protein
VGIDVRMCYTEIMQKRVAYFDCTAALDDSYAALSHAALPFFSLPASLVRPHLRREMVGVSDWRKSFAGSTLRRSAHLQSR